MTADGFKQAMRETDLWPSSCMLATSGERPIGVMLGAKRERANRIVAVGVHPAARGEGHARHMLASLARKLAILGPRRIVAEVPEGDEGAAGFLARCGFVEGYRFADFEGPGGSRADAAGALVAVGSDELERAGCLDHESPRCWDGATERLLKGGERFRGIALPAGDRFAAWLVADDGPLLAARDVLAFGVAEPGRAEPLLALLFGGYAGSDTRPVRLRGVVAGTVDEAVLVRLGFRASGRFIGLVTEAGTD